MNRELSHAMSSGNSNEFIDLAQRSGGFLSLREVALRYALEGIVTLYEVMRISADVDALAEEPLPLLQGAATDGVD